MLRGLDGFFDSLGRGNPLGGQLVRFSRAGEGPVSPLFGGDSEGATPLPIPNRAVKPLSADGTWDSRPWESRSPPVFFSAPAGRPSFLGAYTGRSHVRPGDSADRARRGDPVGAGRRLCRGAPAGARPRGDLRGEPRSRRSRPRAGAGGRQGLGSAGARRDGAAGRGRGPARLEL